MPDLRQDPITKRWVIIASNRANRPLEFSRPEFRASNQICPFCPGNESLTPHEVVRFDAPPGADPEWLVRVIPNLYPALTPNELDNFRATKSGLQTSKPAAGIHEVIIESPRHHRSLTQLTTSEVGIVLIAYREIFQRAANDKRLKSALLFKNNGVAAGISLEHVHSQFVGLPFVSPVVQEELNGAFQWKSKHNECVFCRVLQDEIALNERVVVESASFIAFCPYASRFPHEVWIMPKQHQAQFHQINDLQLDELATTYHRILSKLESTLKNVSYNCLFHSSPFDSFCYDHYHWHIEIIPRIATMAGLEWGAGFHVNISAPEQSASLLRD